jgi:hypothetical protein
VSESDRLARLERAVRRSLELLEDGRGDAAAEELAAVLRAGASELGGGLSEVELERAFDAAQPVADEVIDADRVAQQTLREVDLEALAERLSPPPTFATGTMAQLLERQGDPEGARRIRASLAGREARPPAQPAWRAERERVVATLERWLSNVRRGASA